MLVGATSGGPQRIGVEDAAVERLVVPPDSIRNELGGVAAENLALRVAKPEQCLDNRTTKDLEHSGFVPGLYR
jgi:hypothetical protein